MPDASVKISDPSSLMMHAPAKPCSSIPISPSQSVSTKALPKIRPSSLNMPFDTKRVASEEGVLTWPDPVSPVAYALFVLFPAMSQNPTAAINETVTVSRGPRVPMAQIARPGSPEETSGSLSFPRTCDVPGMTAIPQGRRSCTFTLFTSMSVRFSTVNVYLTISPILQASTFALFSISSALLGTSATSNVISSPDAIRIRQVSNV